MAEAVGPDGWLRPPPRHQRMHPVDVLVDGVLAALDGHVFVGASVLEGQRASCDNVVFTRLPLSDGFLEKGISLDTVWRDIKQVVDRLMRRASFEILHEVTLKVRSTWLGWRRRAAGQQMAALRSTPLAAWPRVVRL